MLTRSRWDAETMGWLLFKIVLGFGWTHAMLFVTPPSIAGAVTADSVGVWTIMTAVGALVSIIGMSMANAKDSRLAVRGYTTELVGLVLFAGGPAQYLGLQVGYILGDGEQFANRYPLSWFAGAMACVIGVRLLEVLRKRSVAAVAAAVFGGE